MPLSVDRSAGVIGPVRWTAGRVGPPGAVEGRGDAVVGTCPLGADGAVHAATTRITPRATRRNRFPPKPSLSSGLREVMTFYPPLPPRVPPLMTIFMAGS